MLLVPTRFTEFHISSPVPSLSLWAKDHLEGGLSEELRRTESPDRQRSGWRPPKSGDQEGDGRPGYPKRSGRPSATS